jgi:thiamine-monophosphate kinase
VLPDAFELEALDDLVGGFLALAHTSRVDVVGGNISRSPGPLVIDVTVLGSVKRRRILTRAGARPGDELYVSGTIGAAAAGLGHLTAAMTTVDRHGADPNDAMAPCDARFLEPEPRLQLGSLLGRNRAATSCVDLSDGLADAVHQLARASGVGAVVDALAVPFHPAASRWFECQREDPVLAGLRGGEDYELLFTVTPKRRSRYGAVRRLVKNLPLTRIGRITREPGVRLTRGGRDIELPGGFSHFS